MPEGEEDEQEIENLFEKIMKGPDWYSSMDLVPACKLKAYQFDSQSGHIGPGPQLGACERQLIDVCLTYQCFFPSLSPFLPLSKNK